MSTFEKVLLALIGAAEATVLPVVIKSKSGVAVLNASEEFLTEFLTMLNPTPKV